MIDDDLPSTATLDDTAFPLTVTATPVISRPRLRKFNSILPPAAIGEAPSGDLPSSSGVGSGSIAEVNGER